ncbi:MAG: hypothetical protein IKH86_09575 [Prevotella sp.]|nr:hypothetical protein [Prevotella sp.]
MADFVHGFEGFVSEEWWPEMRKRQKNGKNGVFFGRWKEFFSCQEKIISRWNFFIVVR